MFTFHLQLNANYVDNILESYMFLFTLLMSFNVNFLMCNILCKNIIDRNIKYTSQKVKLKLFHWFVHLL